MYCLSLNFPNEILTGEIEVSKEYLLEKKKNKNKPAGHLYVLQLKDTKCAQCSCRTLATWSFPAALWSKQEDAHSRATAQDVLVLLIFPLKGNCTLPYKCKYNSTVKPQTHKIGQTSNEPCELNWVLKAMC